MNRASILRILTVGVVAGFGGLSFAACSHVASIGQPLQYMSAQTPVEVWIIRRHNDSLYRIAQPRLQGDTLIGFSLPRPGDPLVKYQEIPLTDVRQMRVKQSAPIRTGLLIAGMVGVAALAYNQIVGQAGGSGAKIAPGNFCDCDFDEVCAC